MLSDCLIVIQILLFIETKSRITPTIIQNMKKQKSQERNIEQRNKPQNEPQLQQFYHLIQVIANSFKITLPDDPFHPKFMQTILTKIVPQWQGLSSNNQIQNWKQIVSFIQQQFLEGRVLDLPQLNQNKLVFTQLSQLFSIIGQIVNIIIHHQQQYHLDPKQHLQSKNTNKNKKKDNVNSNNKINNNKKEIATDKQVKIIKRQKKQQHNLQDQIGQKIRQGLKGGFQRDKKTCKLMVDKQSEQAVHRAKRVFDYTVKEYEKEGKKKVDGKKVDGKKVEGKKVEGKKVEGMVDSHFLKVLGKKHKNIEEAITNEQLRYYLILRDKKIKYIQNIHNLIEKLQKQRQIDLHSKQREDHEREKMNIKMKIQQTQNIFNSNIEQLRESYKKRRMNNKISGDNQLRLCKQIQREIVDKKQKELSEIEMLWKQQCMKLNAIMGDEEKIQQKVIKLYRQNRVVK